MDRNEGQEAGREVVRRIERKEGEILEYKIRRMTGRN